MLRCEWKHRKYQCFLTLVKKNTVNYSVFGHLTLKNHGICSGFCFSPCKNTVNNSNFAVFFMFFVIFWIALVRYTWPSNSSRFFFRQSVLCPWIMPLLCEPNDAVRAVAVAKRREYCPPVIKHGSWTKKDGRIRDALGFIIAMFDYQIWLVVEPPLWKNMKVSWDDYSHLNGKIIQMFQTTNQKWYIPD